MKKITYITIITLVAIIKSPIMLHQGTADDQVPVEWSRELAQNLKAQGKDITYYEYPGEPHTFINSQSVVMQRTLIFFNDLLKNKKN